MRIKQVTITGADDNTHPADLVEISKMFPFVEWGILFSKERYRTERYPSLYWLLNLSKTIDENNADMQLSAHLCGLYSKEILLHGSCDMWKDQVCELSTLFTRHQLNFNASKHCASISIPFLSFLDNQKQPVILQQNKANSIILDSVIACSDLENQHNIHFLYDSSGGRGITPESFASPISGHYTGYSGGVGPDNIKTVIESLDRYIPTNTEVWIDMESNVRTDGKLDLKKVIKVLEAVKAHSHETV